MRELSSKTVAGLLVVALAALPSGAHSAPATAIVAQSAPAPVTVAQSDAAAAVASQPPAPSSKEATDRSHLLLKLDDAETTAREHQPQIVQAHAVADAADARVGEARAPLLPQVSGAVEYQRITGNPLPRGGSSYVSGATSATGTGTGTAGGTTTTGSLANNSFTTYNYFSGSVTASQLIYDFNQTWGKYRAAQSLFTSAAQTEAATRLLIVLNVRTAFFAARADKALAEVARQTVANDKKHLDQIQGFVQAGIRSQIDLAQTQTDLANAELSRVNAENNYDLARQQLNLAMGVIGSTEYDVADDSLPPIKDETSPDLQPIVDEAVRNRPEMASYIAQIKAQEETISSARGAYGPSIAAVAGFTPGGEKLNDLGWNAYVGVSLTWFLFQGGLTDSTVREAQANLRSIAAQGEAQRQQIISDTNSARLAVKAALQSKESAGVALNNAKELLRLAEGQYQTGIGSIIQLSDAQVALSTAQAQVIQTDFNLATARAQLLKALGRP